MIIDNAYFIDEIFIPHAKPSITDNVTAISSDILSFIKNYETDCLIKCLGYKLFKEFYSQVDSTKLNKLKDGVDVKWDRLMNGYEYTDANGEETEWKGIRQKQGENYNKSFIADYVYYFYEKSTDDDRVGVGNVKQEAKNSTSVSKTPKVVAAWRRFFEAVQGRSYFPVIVERSFGVGVDWFGSNREKTLYDFINDMNNLDKLNYPDFKPHSFTNINQFGI